MISSITIYDLPASISSHRIVATNALNQSVCLTGNKARKFLVENYFKGYFSSFDSNSGILPPGVRLVGSNYVVFERPPTYQNIFFNPDRVHSEMDDSNIQVYRIPIPWQVYIATFTPDYYVSDVRMYFSPVSLASLDQPMYLPPIPNFYTNGLLCRPFIANMEDIERYQKNLSGVISCAYDWIWNNGTNNDLNEAMVHVNLQIVARESRDNTLFSKMDNDLYAAYFKNPYNIHYYQSDHVKIILKTWEKFTLEECMNFKWPVPSVDKHFESSYYYPSGDSETVTEHPNYYNWLTEWAREYYDEHTEEDIEYMIDNDEWDGEAYFEYVVHNHLPLKQRQFNSLTLKNILTIINSEASVPSIKNLVNTFVTNAIMMDSSDDESISTSI